VPDRLRVVLDQNLPMSVATWLRRVKPDWAIWHTAEIRLAGAEDSRIFQWACEHQAIIVTYDEDFADQRTYPLGSHYGVVRLRVFPTTAEQTQAALERLLVVVGDDEMRGALVVVDRRRVRLQPPPRT